MNRSVGVRCVANDTYVRDGAKLTTEAVKSGWFGNYKIRLGYWASQARLIMPNTASTFASLLLESFVESA